MSARRLLGLGHGLCFDGNPNVGAGYGPYVDEVAADSPIRWYKLGEATGNAVDSGSEAQDATPHGGLTYSSTGMVSTAPADDCILFNGTTGYFDALQTTYSGDVSFEAIFRVASNPGATAMIFEQYNNVLGHVLTMDTSGRIHLDGKNVTYKSNFTTAGYADNVAHHVVAKQTSLHVDIWIDGVAVAMTNADFAGDPYVATQCAVGANKQPSVAAANFFPGYLQHVAVYDSALSDARIIAHATAGGFV